MSTTISVLANETLCEIFQHLSHSLTIDEWYMQTLPSIRLVSRHWNEIIETMPMLWRSILITEKSAFQAGQFPFQSTRLRLLRSLELPLNIHINLQISTAQHSFNKLDGILLGEIIRVVAPRVASIELRSNSDSRTIQMIILTYLNGTHMPLLHSFSHTDPNPQLIRGARPPDDGYFQNPSSILQYQGKPETRRIITEWGGDLYPSLTDIELVGASYNLEHVPIMRGIRRLRIGAQPLHKRPSIHQMLEILSPARDTLEVLQLEDVVMLNSTQTHLSEPIVFKKLQVLSFGYFCPDIARLFLESVRLPALVDLTLTYTFSQSYGGHSRHALVPLSLIQHFPLDQIERLALVKIIFTVDGSYGFDIAHPEEGMSDGAREVYLQALKERGFVPVAGRWKTTLLMFFLAKFRSLKHLRIHDTVGLKEMMRAYWQQETLAKLETLHFEGNQHPEGLIELVQAVEGQRKLGSRPMPLNVRIGESLRYALSKEERGKLYRHIKALAEL